MGPPTPPPVVEALLRPWPLGDLSGGERSGCSCEHASSCAVASPSPSPRPSSSPGPGRPANYIVDVTRTEWRYVPSAAYESIAGHFGSAPSPQPAALSPQPSARCSARSQGPPPAPRRPTRLPRPAVQARGGEGGAPPRHTPCCQSHAVWTFLRAAWLYRRAGSRPGGGQGPAGVVGVRGLAGGRGWGWTGGQLL